MIILIMIFRWLECQLLDYFRNSSHESYMGSHLLLTQGLSEATSARWKIGHLHPGLCKRHLTSTASSSISAWPPECVPTIREVALHQQIANSSSDWQNRFTKKEDDVARTFIQCLILHVNVQLVEYYLIHCYFFSYYSSSFSLTNSAPFFHTILFGPIGKISLWCSERK